MRGKNKTPPPQKNTHNNNKQTHTPPTVVKNTNYNKNKVLVKHAKHHTGKDKGLDVYNQWYFLVALGFDVLSIDYFC